MNQVASEQRTGQPSRRVMTRLEDQIRSSILQSIYSREDFKPDYSSIDFNPDNSPEGWMLFNDSRDVAPDETMSTHQDVMQCLVKQWAAIAVRHAMTEPIEDPDGMVATIAWISGPWAFGQTAREALSELESVLIDWATMKLEDGDRDIPDMEGVCLVVDRDEP